MRVLGDLEGSGRCLRGFVANFEPHMVCSRRCGWSFQCIIASTALRFSRIWVVGVPDKAICACFLGNPHLLFLVILLLVSGTRCCNRDLLWFLLLTGERFNFVALGIKEGKGYFTCWFFLEVVVDDDAVGW